MNGSIFFRVSLKFKNSLLAKILQFLLKFGTKSKGGETPVFEGKLYIIM